MYQRFELLHQCLAWAWFSTRCHFCRMSILYNFYHAGLWEKWRTIDVRNTAHHSCDGYGNRSVYSHDIFRDSHYLRHRKWCGCERDLYQYEWKRYKKISPLTACRQAPHRSDVLPYKIPLPERKPVSDERLCWGLPDLFLTEQIWSQRQRFQDCIRRKKWEYFHLFFGDYRYSLLPYGRLPG